MNLDSLIIGRVIERLLVVLFGGLALFLGWRLFIVGVVDPQIAEIKFKGWKVTLRQVGPGSVFAALGIAVTAFALYRPLEISDSAKMADTAAGGRRVSYFTGRDDLQHWVRALNTIERLDVNQLTGDSVTASSRKAELARVQEAMVGLRNILLTEKFALPDLQAWQRYQEDYLKDPRSVPGELRPVLSALEPWMTQTMADEK
jgi:hypothetical protein